MQIDYLMDVRIKTFAVKQLGIGVKGIEFDIRTPNGEDHLGDLTITMTQLKWHKGQASKNHYAISIPDFIKYIEAHGKKTK